MSGKMVSKRFFVSISIFVIFALFLLQLVIAGDGWTGTENHGSYAHARPTEDLSLITKFRIIYPNETQTDIVGQCSSESHSDSVASSSEFTTKYPPTKYPIEFQLGTPSMDMINFYYNGDDRDTTAKKLRNMLMLEECIFSVVGSDGLPKVADIEGQYKIASVIVDKDNHLIVSWDSKGNLVGQPNFYRPAFPEVKLNKHYWPKDADLDALLEPLKKPFTDLIDIYNIGYDNDKISCDSYFNTYSSKDDGLPVRLNAATSWKDNAGCCGNNRDPNDVNSDCGRIFTEENNVQSICGNFLDSIDKYRNILTSTPNPSSLSVAGSPTTKDWEKFFKQAPKPETHQSSESTGDLTPDRWTWYVSKDYSGEVTDLDREVVYLPCGDVEVMSLNGKWEGCGAGNLAGEVPQFIGGIKRLDGQGDHDFRCLADSDNEETNGFRGSIVECCAKGDSNDEICHIQGGALTYDESVIRKRQGDLVFKNPKNREFEVLELDVVKGEDGKNSQGQINNFAPLYWSLGGTQNLPSNGPSSKVKLIAPEVPIGVVNKFGKNILSLEYNPNAKSDDTSVLVYSNIFKVEPGDQTVTAYYSAKIVDDDGESTGNVAMDIYWYDDVNDDFVASLGEKGIRKGSREIFNVSHTKIGSNSGFKRHFEQIPEADVGGRFARIVLSVVGDPDKMKVEGKFDNIGFGKPLYCGYKRRGVLVDSTSDPGNIITQREKSQDETKWFEDLDLAGKDSCNAASDRINKVFYTWTGNLPDVNKNQNQCCGDDFEEFYAGKEFGCWNGTIVQNGKLISEGENEAEIILNDTLLYHREPNANGNLQNGNFLVCGELETPAQLKVEEVSPNKKSACEVVITNDQDGYYCTPQGNWSDEGVDNVDGLRAIDRINNERLPDDIVLENGEFRNGCCPENFCWGGNECVADQTNNPGSFDGREGYRCQQDDQGVVGWYGVTKKETFNGEQGVCIDSKKCLIKTKTDPNQISEFSCVEDGRYFDLNGEEGKGDNYCNNGDWTSRSRMLVQDMVEFLNEVSAANGHDEFTIMCDKYDVVLNEYAYIEGDGGNLLEYLSPKRVNNICVAKYVDNNDKEQVAFGITLNQEIDEGDFEDTTSNYPFANLLDRVDLDGDGIEDENDLDCSRRINKPDEYHECGVSQEAGFVYVKDDKNFVIFSRNDISTYLGTRNTFDAFADLFLNPIQSTINLISDVFRVRARRNGKIQVVDAEDLTEKAKAKTFNTLYLSKLGDTSVIGVKENPTGTDEFFTVSFNNFKVDICKSIFAIDETDSQGLSCQLVIDESTKPYFKIFGRSDALSFWPVFTSKLRLQDFMFEEVVESVPQATIIYPQKNTFLVFDEKISFNASLDNNALSYYWDLDANGSLFTGEFEGQHLDEEKADDYYRKGRNPGPVSGIKNITLVVINREGQYTKDSIQVTFTSKNGCDHDLGDINGDGRITIDDYRHLTDVVGLGNCAGYFDITPRGDVRRRKCACADVNQDTLVVYDDESFENNKDFRGHDYSKFDSEGIELYTPEYGFLELCDESCDEEISVSNEPDGIRSIELGYHDNCRFEFNPDQIDSDKKIDVNDPSVIPESKGGDACDLCTDLDGDGVGEYIENGENSHLDVSGCVGVQHLVEDERKNAFDNCPGPSADKYDSNTLVNYQNSDQADYDNDGKREICNFNADNPILTNVGDKTIYCGGDLCDLDDDNDEILDSEDRCPNENYTDCRLTEKLDRSDSDTKGCCVYDSDSRNYVESKVRCSTDESILLYLSDLKGPEQESLPAINSHGRSPFQIRSSHSALCVGKDIFNVVEQCERDDNLSTMIRLSGSTNAHAEIRSDDQQYVQDDVTICLKSGKVDEVICNFAQQCNEEEVPMLSISNTTNAHLGNKDNYPIKVCCGDVVRDTCFDGIRNQDTTDADGNIVLGETSEDCGGPCTGCGLGQNCVSDGDCSSNQCRENPDVAGEFKCVNCNDGLSSPTESDIDCGGYCAVTDNLKCVKGKKCEQNRDCEILQGESTGFCNSQKECGKLADGRQCVENKKGDCASGVCENSKCVSCNDRDMNQDETMADCGGICARDFKKPCGYGKACLVKGDCEFDSDCGVYPGESYKTCCTPDYSGDHPDYALKGRCGGISTCGSPARYDDLYTPGMCENPTEIKIPHGTGINNDWSGSPTVGQPINRQEIDQTWSKAYNCTYISAQVYGYRGVGAWLHKFSIQDQSGTWHVLDNSKATRNGAPWSFTTDYNHRSYCEDEMVRENPYTNQMKNTGRRILKSDPERLCNSFFGKVPRSNGICAARNCRDWIKYPVPEGIKVKGIKMQISGERYAVFGWDDSKCTLRSCEDKHCGVDTSVPLHCMNNNKDIDEGGIDCGGSCPNKCEVGSTCNENSDCANNNCRVDSVGGPSMCIDCGDGFKNRGETDVDCGGYCVPEGKSCDNGKTCNTDIDCVTGFCNSQGICGPTDNLFNCERDDECKSNRCVEFTTDDRARCSLDYTHINFYADNIKCEKWRVGEISVQNHPHRKPLMTFWYPNTGKRCVSCDDKVQNGDETDVDCGGSTCSKRCGYYYNGDGTTRGDKCLKDSDCLVDTKCDSSTGSCCVPEYPHGRCGGINSCGKPGREDDLNVPGLCGNKDEYINDLPSAPRDQWLHYLNYRDEGQGLNFERVFYDRYRQDYPIQMYTEWPTALECKEIGLSIGGYKDTRKGWIHNVYVSDGGAYSDTPTLTYNPPPSVLHGNIWFNVPIPDGQLVKKIKIDVVGTDSPVVQWVSSRCKPRYCTDLCVDCENGIRGYGESGVDCGGKCLELYDKGCAAGGQCKVDSDCSIGKCENKLCSPYCDNGQLDIDKGETDVDCGGVCGKCELGKDCSVAADCSSGACVREVWGSAHNYDSRTEKVCTYTECGNGVHDPGEQGSDGMERVDCGGQCEEIAGIGCPTSQLPGR